MGLDELNGIQVGLDDLRGEVLGHSIELYNEDERCTSEGGGVAAKKIAGNRQVVLALGGTCSSATRVAAPILWAARIPNIGISPAVRMLTGTNRAESYQGFLRVIFNDAWVGRLVAEYAWKVREIDRVATIHDGSSYSRTLVETFEEEFADLGGHVCASERVRSGGGDVGEKLTKIARCQPKWIYAPLFPVAAGRVVRESREMPSLERVVLFGADAVLTKDFLREAGPSVIGYLIATESYEEEIRRTAYREMRRRYKAKFGKEPDHGFHHYAYDALMMGVEALKKVAVTDDSGNLHIPIKALRDALFGTKNHEGLTDMLTCDAHGDCGLYELNVYEFINDDPNSF